MLRKLCLAVLAAAVAAGPLTVPAQAAGRVVRVGNTGRGLDLKLNPGGATGGATALGLNRANVSVSLGGVLPAGSGSLAVRNSADTRALSSERNFGIPIKISAQAYTPAAGSRSSLPDAGLDANGRADGLAAPVTRAETLAETGVSAASPASAKSVQRTISRVRALAAAQSPKQISDLAPGAAYAQGAKLFESFRAAAEEANFSRADEWDETNALSAAEAETPPAVPARLSWRARLGRGISGGVAFLARSPAGAVLPQKLGEKLGREPLPVTRFSPDEFGGPARLELALPRKTGGALNAVHRWLDASVQKLAYAGKWALSMMGVSALLSFTLKPLAALFPWQLWLSESFLESTGRVELLTAIGPQAITKLLESSPIAFLTTLMPTLVFMEELSFRLLAFWGPLLAFILLGKLAKRIVGFLNSVPLPTIFGGARRTANGLLSLLTPSWVKSLFTPYGAAAAISSFLFASAHIAAWGFAPHTFAIHFVLGLVLARVAYRTRSLLVPFVAHFLFNLATIALNFWLPLAAAPAIVEIVTGIAGAVLIPLLAYNYWAHRSAKSAAIAEARGQRPGSPARGWPRLIAAALLVPLLYAAIAAWSPARAPAESPKEPAVSVSVLAPAVDTTKTGPMGIEQGLSLQEILNRLMGKDGAAAATAETAKVLSTAEMVKKVKPAVVMVKTPAGGIGSGFIIDEEGLLVTNAHVVSQGVSASWFSGQPKIDRAHHAMVVIVLANGAEVPGKVVGFNPDKDIALVQLPPNRFGWAHVKIGDSGKLGEGEKVVAMGHPRGLPFSVSEGIVSGLDGRNNGFVRYIQHDASVNPGNSGGPLFNERGEVVGINSMIMSSGGGFDGIAYSITAADLKKALEQFTKIGNIDSPWIGALFNPSDPDAPKYGAAIELVRPDSPAAEAGLRGGDIILSIDGRKLSNNPRQAVAQLMMVMRHKIPTDKLELKISRGGEVRTITVELGN